MTSKVGKRTRQLLVFLHVAVSVGWMGAGAANVVLAMSAGYTSSVDVRRVCYHMIDRIDVFVVIPLAFAALISGVLLCVVTPWGLARYWWVLAKLVLTVTVIVFSTFGLGVWVEQSIEATTASTKASEVAGLLGYGAALNIVAFLFMTWASVAKPWGTTPWTSSRGRTRRPAGRTADALRRP
jgi:hypothetical protein